MNHKIEVRRKGLIFDLFRSYTVTVNEIEKKINPNEKKFWNVSNKVITVNAFIDWCSAKPYHFEIEDDSQQITKLKVHTNTKIELLGIITILFFLLSLVFDIGAFKYLGALTGIPLILGLTVFRKDYLKISKIE